MLNRQIESFSTCALLLGTVRLLFDQFDLYAFSGKTAYLLNRLPNEKWYAADKPSRVELLRKNTAKIETNLEIISGDSTKLDFEDGKFDGILLGLVQSKRDLFR